MLEVRNLTVRYGELTALHGITFRVARGEVVGLVGPNGAGKSTTLHTIAGLLQPTHGEVVFDGQSLVRRRPEAIVQLGISLVPEGRRIFNTLTVAENLALGARGATGRSKSRLPVERVLELFPVLAGYYRASAGGLSGGEQQQLAIARALLAQPQLLLLDEPSLGLAPMVVDLVFGALEELRRDGVTVVLVEQKMVRTVEFADRTYVLSAGRVAVSGSRDELDEAALAGAYLGF